MRLEMLYYEARFRNGEYRKLSSISQESAGQNADFKLAPTNHRPLLILEGQDYRL